VRDDLRRRFVAARCALREVLALACSQDAAELHLGSGEFGKPMLLDCELPIHFNLSHCGPLALLALSRLAPVGVDIELHQPMPEVEALALEHLTPEEWSAYAQQACSADFDGLQRERAFLRLWTRKEACLKAWGCGLQLQPHHVAVGWGEESCRVAAPDPGLGQALRLVSLRLPENMACEAAVALGPLSMGTGCSTRQQDH
jgi:4'-phosphopantetheinyl transferase